MHLNRGERLESESQGEGVPPPNGIYVDSSIRRIILIVHIRVWFGYAEGCLDYPGLAHSSCKHSTTCSFPISVHRRNTHSTPRFWRIRIPHPQKSEGSNAGSISRIPKSHSSEHILNATDHPRISLTLEKLNNFPELRWIHFPSVRIFEYF